MGSRGELGWDLQVTAPSDPWHSGLEVTVWEPKWAWGGVTLGLPIILQTPPSQAGWAPWIQTRKSALGT